jgi:CSLREA domain-containing protein
MGRGGRRSILLLTALAAMSLPQFAGAATIQVTTTVDESLLGKAGCSLREAIQTANANANYGGCTRSGTSLDDTVRLQGGSTYPLALPGVDDTNAGGDLDVTGTLAIEVGGAGRATIDGGDIDRVIEVRPGADLTATDLVIQNGELPTTDDGAGVLNQGRLVLRSSIVQENHIEAPLGSGGGAGIGTIGPVTTIVTLTKIKDNVIDGHGTGGGIDQAGGVLKVKKSTIAGNTAYGGGGLAVYDDINATVKASTISGNTGLSEQFAGGGIYRYDGNGATQFPMRIVNTTISGNQSAGAGGGIYDGAGYVAVVLNGVTVTLNVADFDSDNSGQISGSGGGLHGAIEFDNSIVAGNTATNTISNDCYQVFEGDHNLVGRDAGCANPGVGTLDPKLGALKDNGGPTKTHALLKGSPAIGKAGGSAPGKDQRGRRRDSDPDAGSFERGA